MARLIQRLFTVEEEVERPKAAKEDREAADAEQTATEGIAAEATTQKSIKQETTTQESTPQESAVLTENALREPVHGLIPASKLPPAADVLAELFAEKPATEETGAEAVRAVKIAELTPAAPASGATPKRRGIFARLLTFNRPPRTTPEKLIPVEQGATEDTQSKTVTESAAPAETVIESMTEALTEAAAEIVTESAGVAEPQDLGEGWAAEIPPSAEMPQAPISAVDLPSAALDFEKLFPPAETLVEATAQLSPEVRDELRDNVRDELQDEAQEAVQGDAREDVRDEETAQESIEDRVEELVEVASSASAELNLEAPVPEPASSFASMQREGGEAFSADARHDARTDETSAEVGHGDARVGSREAERPYETAGTVAGESTNLAQAVETPEGKIQTGEPREASVEAAVEPAVEAPAVEPEAPRRLYKDWAFDEKLASHREWVESHGRTGQRADLSGAELEATDLISVNLRLADLHDTNLRASDMLLADLRDACLVRADLEESCLVGANLEGANLEGASLETAMGLVPRQFAGANLRDALLAPQLMEFEAVGAFERASQHAFHYFAAMTAASVLSWLVIWKTRDVQLLTDSAVIPFLHSHAAATALPTAESYLIVPAALFILYLMFHFYLQRLWDAVMELPAIFPDGHTLGDRGPGIITGLMRTHFRWMNPDPSSTRLVEKGVSLLAAYWVVPATLLLFWARYLTRQEIHGTILQVLLVVIATGIASYATTKVGKPQERWAIERKWTQRIVGSLKAINPISAAGAFGVVLLLLSVGIIAGVPHGRSRAPQYGATNIRRWAANIFWSLAFDPYANLTEASISQRPANWSGADDQVASVDGLRANNAKFRYAQAYGAFLANSHLWQADFQGAFLSEADLRSADMGQSNMRFAVLDHAQMNHANLDRSNLDGADLRRADLRDANLSYCSLTDAILVDARLDSASLYTARLSGATLTRASLEKADLRESYLGGAHMDHADLRNAYLWSAKLPGADLGGAQMESAILIDADLHGANLGGAQLTGTVLNGADLSGTSLEGADLRGALGLGASQVCSAKSRRGAVLDAEMETQVETQCGK